MWAHQEYTEIKTPKIARDKLKLSKQLITVYQSNGVKLHEKTPMIDYNTIRIIK